MPPDDRNDDVVGRENPLHRYLQGWHQDDVTIVRTGVIGYPVPKVTACGLNVPALQGSACH
jgi:hypothetical protein